MFPDEPDALLPRWVAAAFCAHDRAAEGSAVRAFCAWLNPSADATGALGSAEGEGEALALILNGCPAASLYLRHPPFPHWSVDGASRTTKSPESSVPAARSLGEQSIGPNGSKVN
jgi:hypothetical protein